METTYIATIISGSDELSFEFTAPQNVREEILLDALKKQQEGSENYYAIKDIELGDTNLSFSLK